MFRFGRDRVVQSVSGILAEMTMEIRQHAVGSITVLDPVGRLVLSEGESHHVIKDIVSDLMTRGHRHFLVDLSHVSQVDTSGLTTLVSAHLAVVRRGGQIKLVHPTQRLRQVLAVTKLTLLLEVFERDEDAIASFEPSR